MNIKDKLISLYKEMYDLTLPECKSCRVPLSCCSPEYCEMAKGIAKNVWGVELQSTDHPKLPFMSPTGCIVPPHLRPNCTMHTCDINSLGFKKNNPVWTDRYFALREQIEQLEWKLYEESTSNDGTTIS